ncbi:MAG: RNA methyltransferase [Flavobacterium sp.]|jgi:tRNA (guanosine-2'-O-)-methyltransferase|nr:RNA methyltransferase [Flavobacterium sp.]MBT6378368.1 RNA methyltransferase [Flavobacterium sp.]MBT6881792.1 RNA methyltransferase [Flavobacterium sp.]MBT7425602.1 RNA methyltransferase [Flavobacterium sp.]
MLDINTKLLTYLEGFVTDKRKKLFRNILQDRTRHFTVVLEDIYQQHNASAVIRSCDIFGIQDVHVIENKYKSKVSKNIAKGSQKWLSFHNYKEDTNNTLECLNSLKSKGYQIIATTPHNNSCSLHDFDISKKSAFVFGVEKTGVSDLVMNNADKILRIPMVGFTESLNISVAAAIILENLSHQLRNSALDWALTVEEQQILYTSWIEKTIKNVDEIKERFIKNNS